MTIPEGVLVWWERVVRASVATVVGLASGGLFLGFLGWYRPLPVVLVAGATAGLVLWLWHRTLPAVVDPDDNGWALVVGVVSIAVIVALHARYSGNFFFISRDPAFYNLLGLDLARTGDLTFDNVTDPLRGIEGLRVASQGLADSSDDSEVYVQGFHGLEPVIAPTEWIGGLRLYLRATALLGGVALLTLRRVVVRVSSPWIATIITAALGLSIPFAEFTRNPYSEILVVVCVLGSLLVLLEMRLGPHGLLAAAMVAGVAVTARIDAFLVASGFAAAMILLPVVTERRWIRLAELVAILGGMGLTSALGWYVGYRRSPAYVQDLSDDVRNVWLVVALMAAGVLAVYAVRWVLHRTSVDLAELLDRRVAFFCGALTFVGGIGYWYLAPILLELHGPRFPIGTKQQRELRPVDETRTYGEEALRRLEFNYGTLLVALGVVGAALVVYRLVLERSRVPWLLIAIGLPSAPYLVMNRITPDMPWAMRRFLPVIIPVTLILAAVALQAARELVGVHRRPVLAMLATVSVAAPLSALAPVVEVRPEANTIGFTRALCRGAPGEVSTAFVTDELLATIGLQTIEAFCGIDAVAAERGSDPARVASDVSDALGDQPILFITGVGAALPDGFVERSRTTHGTSLPRMTATLTEVPSVIGAAEISADAVVAVRG